VSTKIVSKSPFFDPICALSIPGVEEQSKCLRTAENQLKKATVPDFGFGSSLKADQSFKSHQKFLFAHRIRVSSLEQARIALSKVRFSPPPEMQFVLFQLPDLRGM
jgi:hypothetical protein